MSKKKSSFRSGLFFLVGVLVYSLFFWLTGKNVTHVFGMIIVALACYILYQLNYRARSEKAPIQPKDVIYMCIGVVFDSLSGAFPFGMFA
ncbi:MAG: hypothetical protein JSS61_06015 [Verrucomicrobia bacterium]|nr:hypothetical protein [Verrucomicrobiota bacterium]